MPVREAVWLNRRAIRAWTARYPRIFLPQTLQAVAAALAVYAGLFLSARIIDELAGARDKDRLVFLVAVALGTEILLALGIAVLKRWRNATLETTYQKENALYADKLLSMDFSAVDDQKTHDLRSQVDQNRGWGSWGLFQIGQNLDELTGAGVKIVGAALLTASLFTLRVPESGGALTALNSPLFLALLALVMLGVTLLSPAFSNLSNRYVVGFAEDLKFSNRLFFVYGFMGYERQRATDVRVYRQNEVCARHMHMNDSFDRGSKFDRLCKGPMGGYEAAAVAVPYVFTGAVYAYVCLKAYGGAFGVGAVTQYVAALTALADGLSALLKTLGEMRANASFLKTTFEFLDIPNEMYQGSLTTEKRGDRKYRIEFRDVSFKYPTADSWALRHVSLNFRVGEKLAVVGRNGSGKTTFIKLLCRLYDPTEGEILLNGIDIRKYDYREYLDLFSVVFQDFKLLAFSLGENVAARTDCDAGRTEECLKEAGMREMPLETPLYKEFDEKGVEVSGGEAQKIALARALYKDAPFIVLDEPTAALDPVAEYEVYTKFNEIVGDRTAVYISHRLASCRFCDEIAVFEEGKIVQKGTHEALAAREGAYRTLWNAQAQYYRPDQSAPRPADAV